ncbi:alanine/glycine:cation symporter family protein [Halalkalibacterium halodurans]|uniref:Sodium:alanine symporter n=1 Tax=Halalkalibacterium halodurans TaxID=86665 RepID=A0A0M0KKV0_ALKHA|nr:alanine:cation symporter family protein [Halalkalibacterium halodurans]
MENWFRADTWFGRLVDVGNTFIWTYVLIALLLGLGLYFTFVSRFVQFRLLGEMGRLLVEGMNRKAFKERKGTSSFQAFAISTAARVGTGNLAGVAVAISLGGPGAIFWMWIIALIGAATGFIESTLAQIYKVKDKDGFRGGPAYYMEKALNARWAGILFAILITLCFGLIFNAVQTHTIADAFVGAYDLNPFFIGLIIAFVMAFIVFGGIRRIAVIAEVIVPTFAIAYVLIALVIVLLNITQVPAVIGLIVGNAFGIQEVVGGGFGAAIMHGIRRGLFSNEAGMGSAPNAAATAHVSHPVKQGLVQSLSVLTDTLIICSATAFLILLTDVYTVGEMGGIQLTQEALTVHIGEWSMTFVTIAIFFFAFSSLLGNYYYGEANIQFISQNRALLTVFRLAFLAMILIGATSELQIIWEMADLIMGAMAIVNLIAIALLAKIAVQALTDYQHQRKQGIDPVFYKNSLPDLKNIEAWDEKPVKEKN